MNNVYSGNQNGDAEFEAGLRAHKAKVGKLSGSEIATASMAKVLSETGETPGFDESTGSGVAKASMARILQAGRAS